MPRSKFVEDDEQRDRSTAHQDAQDDRRDTIHRLTIPNAAASRDRAAGRPDEERAAHVVRAALDRLTLRARDDRRGD